VQELLSAFLLNLLATYSKTFAHLRRTIIS
jgi:hypothetical protein